MNHESKFKCCRFFSTTLVFLPIISPSYSDNFFSIVILTWFSYSMVILFCHTFRIPKKIVILGNSHTFSIVILGKKCCKKYDYKSWSMTKKIEVWQKTKPMVYHILKNFTIFSLSYFNRIKSALYHIFLDF